MKKPFCLLGLLAALSLACVIQAPVSSQQPEHSNVATIVAATLDAMVTPAPAQPATAIPPTSTNTPAFNGLPVTAGNTSFVIPNGLASGASVAQIPAADEQNSAPWDVAPAHLEITLEGDTVQNGFSMAKIFIYPALEYATAHQGAAESIKRLQAILANPGSEAKDNLPAVPFFNAAQMFVSQINTLKFQNGMGVRMITQYGQAVGQITNAATFYHFQGLTSDNKYYIIVILPIQSTLLVSDDNPDAPAPPGGVQFPGYNAPADQFDSYFIAVSNLLNSAAPETFIPNLTALDILIQSLTVSGQS